MEEGSFSETIVGSLVKLYDFVDSCLMKMEDDGVVDAEDSTTPPRSKRKAVASAIKRIIYLIRRKDKEYEALLARNKMLESKLKNVSHVIRALDKVSRIPEVPVLVKQENLSLSEEDTIAEEQVNHLSIIAETTEPEIIEEGESEPEDRDNFNEIQEDQDSSSEDLGDIVGSNIHKTDGFLTLQEKQPKKQSINPTQNYPLPQLNPHGIETSTPKPTRDQKETENTGRRFFPKPRISDRILRPSTKVVGGSSSDETIEEKATIPDGIEMINIEMREIEVSIAQCNVNHNETIRVHDDTKQIIYSDISSDDETLNKQVGRDESKFRKRSTSHESNSENSNTSSQTKFKLKEAVLDVEKLCSTEKFKQSQAKIQHELLKNKMNKHMKRKKIDTKYRKDYEDTSDDNKTTRKKLDNKNNQDHRYEDNSDDNGVSDDNFTDAMSKISNSPEHELIDLIDIEDEVTHGKRHIRFEEELDRDLVSLEDLASDEGSIDSVEHASGRVDNDEKVIDEESTDSVEHARGTVAHDEKDIDEESSDSVEQVYHRGNEIEETDNEVDSDHRDLEDGEDDDNGVHDDKNKYRENTDENNDDSNVSDDDVENIEDADENADQVKDEALENIRRRPAFWKPKKEPEGVMEATYNIDFDLTIPSVLINEHETTRREDMEHILNQVNENINPRDVTKEKEKNHAIDTTKIERSDDRTVEVDLLTINNYDSADETLVDFPADQYDEDQTDKDNIYVNKHQINKDITNCNNSDVKLRGSTDRMNKYGTHRMNKYGTRRNDNASPHEHPEQYDESTSTGLSTTNKPLVYNARNSVNKNSKTFPSYQEGCEINGIGTANMSRGYGRISTNKVNEERVEWYTREHTDESCQERSGGERTLTVKQNKKTKEKTRPEENGYDEDIISYTSDENYDKTETDTKTDYIQGQVEPGLSEPKGKFRRAPKLPAEATSDTDESTMESSSREELRPKHNLRGRRRKLSVSESEEDEVLARKYPKRQTSKLKLATSHPEQGKAETQLDAEQKRGRPKRFCAKPKPSAKVEEKEKEAILSQVKPKVQTRVRGQKRNGKGSEA